MLNDNGPTHVDAFSHLDPTPGSQTIDQMPLELFYGPAICLDVSHVPERTDITANHLDSALAASGLALDPDDL
ncbi:MAG: cyclase family protein, partial [bacterium]